MDGDWKFYVNETENKGRSQRRQCSWIIIIGNALISLTISAITVILMLKFVALEPKESSVTTTTATDGPSKLSINACIRLSVTFEISIHSITYNLNRKENLGILCEMTFRINHMMIT